MRVKAAWLAVVALLVIGTLSAFQRPFKEFPGVEYRGGPMPPDWQEKTEWAFARLMFPSGSNDGYYPRFQGNYHYGLSLWTQDYPKADRQFSLAVRRLTRVHSRSVEQVVDLEDGNEPYYWPWVYAVQVGMWGLTANQGKILREYLLRGGFFVADDFHGNEEYEVFEKSMKLVFPDRPIQEIPDDNPIFHTLYDLNEKVQVPGRAHLRLGYKEESGNGARGAHWKGIFDDHGRIMIAISYNSDLGDAWEWADRPEYPLPFADFAMRIGVNYVIYSMTH